MLESLSIKNFALIENLQVSWKSGLNVLTGETGAGKSILIDALSVLLGAKAGPGLIRPGAEKAQLEGIFHLSPNASEWLKEQELIEPDNQPDNQELIIARELSKSGSRFRINGTLVNQTLAYELRQFLISIHAQHEARTLMSAQAQLEMLDALADKTHAKLLADVHALWANKKDLDRQLKELAMSEEERLRRIDFGRFQLSELHDANLNAADEDIELAQQASILSHVAALSAAVVSAQTAIVGDGDDSDTAAIDMLQLGLSELDRGLKLDTKLETPAALLRSSLANIEEAALCLRKYHDGLEKDPEALQTIESRIAQLATIKRKYGPTLDEAIAKRNSLELELARLDNTQIHLDELNSARDKLARELEILCKELSQKRQILGQKLSKRLVSELAELGMERCRFEISLEPLDEAGPHGKDRLEFLIAPNPGQPLLPLAKIASGGELSRIMLVIKSIFAEADQVSTVIFDEIDTGISGRVLQSMRDKLSHLAKSHQILCITHQPVIAAIADNHLQINKFKTEKTTTVSVKELVGDERLKALAEMASGQEDEQSAISFARSLMK